MGRNEAGPGGLAVGPAGFLAHMGTATKQEESLRPLAHGGVCAL